MPYATAADVATEFPGVTFGASGQITDTILGTWLTDASNQIDSMICNRYVVPVTSGTQALSILKAICLDLVSAKIRTKLPVGDGEQLRSQVDLAEKLDKSAMARLKMLNEAKSDLIDAASANVPVAESYNRENDVESYFKVDEDQW